MNVRKPVLASVKFKLIIIFTVIFSQACTVELKTLQMYPGNQLSASESSSIRGKTPEEEFPYSDRTLILSVDGTPTEKKAMGEDGVHKIVILPGIHTIVVKRSNNFRWADFEFQFMMQKGESYIIKTKYTTYETLLWVENEKTGQTIKLDKIIKQKSS